ncbi:alternative ribosome rescue aminoacyl-tRNA hydrolase ArfB [Bartonella sp. HY329]|uniref:alternative ribosome rescue aminoacyl-tRNA hydrolase ArfB n=1 Tax=unclassified Bartonella TaxID=2645622 RepID=UPI0021CA6335|nr:MULTISPECIES: alternative ribosome rescue aminoacyl-tRNA hydrolase ArfB [unclassified Bartonella]UXM95465.1 alternative ribosome rescue aminoacyl-tRNA hydrolase ArfB [Bartonella sp. HY329]UXN09791.1 alternative ribosome rescue aminoacyl-tRNA hydrolase ArfB [Bartonella sp. HY328]
MVQKIDLSDDFLLVNETITIHKSSFEESFIRASGPGGQNVNKVATAVQLRFFPQLAGISADIIDRLIKLAGQRATKDGQILLEADRFRTQERNRIDARERLVDLLRKASAPPPPPRKKTRPTKASVERRLVSKTSRGSVKKLRGRVKDD